MRKIEILAPAGSFEALKAAINGGCDAVYVGGSQFGARAYANNFEGEQLVEAINYVHIHGKQLFLTVNTLLKNEELKQQLLDYLRKPYEAGLDAVIVQDLGVLQFVHEHFPNLPIHCSTQMSLTMANGVNLLKEYGVTRLVTARELSMEEIKQIRETTDLEIESFVHGALCFSYSGQCLMSSMLGGRSGNRGRCAQTCRMQYELVKDDKVLSNSKEPYLLSPKDICTLDLIPDLVESGIDSFKIEGRMKRPEYTALVSNTYRKYVDLYQKLGKEQYQAYLKKHKDEYQQDVNNMMEIYNRGNSSTGYYTCHNGSHMMSPSRPNHNGRQVGEIVSVKGNRATFLLKEDIFAQDVLEFRGKNDVSYDYTVGTGVTKGNTVTANYKSGLRFQKGDFVYRTKSQQLIDAVDEQFIFVDRKVPMKGCFVARLGQPIRLELTVRDTTIMATGQEAQSALKQPISKEKVEASLRKTNTTMFEFEHLDIQMDDDIFLPVGWLNELRREAVELLMTTITAGYQRTYQHPVLVKDVKESLSNGETGLSVLVMNQQQLNAAISVKEVTAIYYRMDDYDLEEVCQLGKVVIESQKEYYLVLPHVFRADIYDRFQSDFNRLGKDSLHWVTGFVVKNIEEYEFLLKNDLLQKKIILDYNFYTMNEEAKRFWKGRGIHHFTASVELTYQELRELGCMDSDVVVYGHIPLMTSAQCVVKNSIGCRKQTSTYYLRDRYKKDFIVVNHCKNCYNSIYNADPIFLLGNRKEIMKLKPKNVRLEFTVETPNQMISILNAYAEEYIYQRNSDLTIKNFTKGHFKRGIE